VLKDLGELQEARDLLCQALAPVEKTFVSVWSSREKLPA
jgi:hypothetical protein